MKIIVSIVLTLVISLTGVAFAIEGIPGEIETSIINPTESLTTENNEIKEDTLIDPNMSVDLPSGGLDDSVSNTNEGGEKIDKVDENPLPNKLVEPVLMNEKESTISLPSINVSFTSPIFKIIVLAVAVIIIILLILSLSRKKDTMYAGHQDIPPKKRLSKTAKKEVLPDLKLSKPNISPIEEREIIIPPIEMEEDLILNFEKEEDLDFNLADNFPKDIEVALNKDLDFNKVENIDNINNVDNIDDIDDIDQLSKAIEEKEAQLKKLEEEMLKENSTNEKIKEDVDIENVLEEVIDFNIVKDIKEEVKKDKSKEKKVDEKSKAVKDNKTKTVPEIKSKKTETEKLKTKVPLKKEEQNNDLVEDFLKNMEKSMKEDNKK